MESDEGETDVGSSTPAPHEPVSRATMSAILAIGFVVLGVLGVISYNGTPHDGPTAVCSPISIFGSVQSVPFDCRYFSLGEVIFTVICFLLAVVAAFSARPKQSGPTM